jgi:uncharacterized phiE125 gp8 family phage protein
MNDGRTLHRVPWELTATPSGPVSALEAKAYARITHFSEDLVIDEMLAGCIETAETATRRTIQLGRWDLVLDSFSCGSWIELRRPPVVSIEEITYRNSDAIWTPIAEEEYLLELDGDHARVGPLPGESWPSASSSPRSVRIRYKAGYRPFDYVQVVDETAPPRLIANLATGIKELFALRFENRGEPEFRTPGGLDALFWSERVDL